MRRRLAAALSLLAAAAFLGLAGCDKPTEPRVCTAIAVDALVVTVVDASSGQKHLTFIRTTRPGTSS